MTDHTEKDARRAKFAQQRRVEAKKLRLLAKERDSQERNYFQRLARREFTRTTGDEREAWVQ